MLDHLFDTLLISDEEFGAMAAELAGAYPGLVRLEEIGKSQEGRPIRLLTVTEFSSGEEKPALFIQGTIHSKELSGTLAALDVARRLAADHIPGGILSRAVFYIMPRCNPDGAHRMATCPGDERSSWGDYTDTPNGIERCDLDGDGLSKTMLVEDPDGELCFSPKHRLCLVHRTENDKGPFYKQMPEGILHNFDRATLPNWPPFAREYLDWNRNWPGRWGKEQFGCGSAPLSVPEVRIQHDWITAHPNIKAAIALHNGYGSFMLPSVRQEDEEYVKSIGSRGETLIGYPALYGDIMFASDAQKPSLGKFDDYCYSEQNMLCVTIELGTRENSAGADTRELFHRQDAYSAPWEVVEQQDAHPELPRCIFEWKEFEHPQLGKILLGGSCPTLFASPLLDHLEKVSAGVYQFTLGFAIDFLNGRGVGRAKEI